MALLAPTLALLAGAAPGAGLDFEQDVKPLLTRSCYACHNPALRNADLNLASFETEAAVLADAKTWEKVAEKTRTRQMPPAPFPPLSDDEVHGLTGWIEAAFERQDAAAAPDPGRVTARRLNRAEYDNTVRDLVGVSLRPALDFPQDDSGYGFDNNGDVLSLSPALMERYVTAAERVARTALFGPAAPKPGLVKPESVRARIEPSPTVPAEYDATGLTLRNAVHATYRAPVTGEYLVRAILGGERPAASEPVEVGFYVDDAQAGVRALDPTGLGSFGIDRQDFTGKTRELRVKLTAGEHRLSGTIVRIFEGLPPSYGGPNPSKRPAPPPREFKPRPNATPEQIAKAKEAFEKRMAEVAPANDVRVARLEVLGPYEAVTGPSAASLGKVYGTVPRTTRTLQAARRVLAPLARRAYRRPVTAADVDPLVALVQRTRARGDRFEDGMALALQAMLVSPDFLFRTERGRPDPAGGPGRVLTDHELATRLSYFLWVSMPDEALLDLADQGRLAQPAVLEAQVARMLKDEKAVALVEAFAGQWLQFRGLEAVAPDRERFPDFDSGLRYAMRRETELLFLNLLRENRSLLDLVDARYTFVNERLARHYGIAGVKGPEFRKVELEGGRRGGVMTHASVLTVSSYATRTSPVLRGKWILENMLNAPPPDPPPGVPRLDETKVGAEASLREQLEAHRTQPSCRACHEGPARLLAGELRCDRQLARGRRQVADRRVRHAARRPSLRGGERARECLEPGPRGLRPGSGVEADDVRARARPRALRSQGLGPGRGARRSERLSLLGARARDREEPAVPAAERGGVVNPVMRHALDRRTVLRGLGASLALPALDAMTPAFAEAGPMPLRLIFTYVPNGVTLADSTPRGEGTSFELSRILKPLEPYRERIVILSGLAQKNGNALGDGPGDHARAGGAYLTGVHPRKTAGADIQNGISVDQIAAAAIGDATRLASFELGCEESRTVGNCDSGYSCAYTNSISWRSATMPMPPETNPRMAFERLFGADDVPLDAKARAKRLADRRSVLDAVLGRAGALSRELGPSDKRKLDEYLSGVREAEYVRLMLDLQVAAIQADLTRLSTFMVGREGSLQAYPEIGVPDSHHPLTHHRGQADLVERVTKINTFHVELFAHLLKRLSETREGDGTLLDHVAVVYGSGLSDGDRHTHEDLPLLIAGGANGKIHGGRHVVYPSETPMTNLFLTLLDQLGVPAESLGDSTGWLAL